VSNSWLRNSPTAPRSGLLALRDLSDLAPRPPGRWSPLTALDRCGRRTSLRQLVRNGDENGLCTRRVPAGHLVCRHHGGRLPNVRRKAELRAALLAYGLTVHDLGLDPSQLRDPRLVLLASQDRLFQLAEQPNLDPLSRSSLLQAAGRLARLAIEAKVELEERERRRWREEAERGVDAIVAGLNALPHLSKAERVAAIDAVQAHLAGEPAPPAIEAPRPTLGELTSRVLDLDDDQLAHLIGVVERTRVGFDGAPPKLPEPTVALRAVLQAGELAGDLDGDLAGEGDALG
jgi:hypothetical protein